MDAKRLLFHLMVGTIYPSIPAGVSSVTIDTEMPRPSSNIDISAAATSTININATTITPVSSINTSTSAGVDINATMLAPTASVNIQVEPMTILTGTLNPPMPATGVDGDYYINTDTSTFYGPKAAGVWPAGVSLITAAGNTTSIPAAVSIFVQNAAPSTPQQGDIWIQVALGKDAI